MGFFRVQTSGIFGNGAKTHTMTEKQVEELLDKLPRDEATGEVKGVTGIRRVDESWEDVHGPDRKIK